MPASRQYATDLGVALQLTNILRDVPEDLAARPRLHPAGRISARTACTEERSRARKSSTPARGVRSPNVKALLRQQAERARGLLRAGGGRALPRADARRLVAAEIMGAIYRAHSRPHRAARLRRVQSVVRVPRPRARADRRPTWARTGAYGL